MKDKIEQFIRDMRSVPYWSKEIREKNLELEAIAVQLQGVSSIPVKPIIYENAGNPYSNQSKLALMEKEQEKIQERQILIDRIMDVSKIFNCIDNIDNIKDIMIDLHLIRMKQDEVVIKYSYTRGHIYKKINKSIKDAMMIHCNQNKVVK